MGDICWIEIGKVMSYIITVIIGGVGYKFYSLYTTNKTAINQQALDSILKQNVEFASMIRSQNERISALEEDNRKYHREFIEVTKKQVRAEAKVEMLQNRIDYLEKELNLTRSISDFNDQPPSPSDNEAHQRTV